MNRMIRTLLALLAVMGMVFALAGCAQPTPEPTEPPAEEEEAEAPAEEEEEARRRRWRRRSSSWA